jgi:hypothetical protein
MNRGDTLRFDLTKTEAERRAVAQGARKVRDTKPSSHRMSGGLCRRWLATLHGGNRSKSAIFVLGDRQPAPFSCGNVQTSLLTCHVLRNRINQRCVWLGEAHMLGDPKDGFSPAALARSWLPPQGQR